MINVRTRVRGRRSCRRLRFSNAAFAVFLCLGSVGLTLSVWNATFRMIQSAEMGALIVIGLLAATSLAWIRRSRWRVCGVQHRAIGSLGIFIGALLVATSESNALLAQIGAVLLIVSSLTVALGVEAMLRFSPVLWTLAITVMLVRCEGALENLIVPENKFAGDMIRLTPEVMLIAYLFAFVTPFYLWVRAAIVIASPAAAAAAIVLAPGIAWACSRITGGGSGTSGISNLLALTVVLGLLSLAHKQLRKAGIPLGPFTLTRM